MFAPTILTSRPRDPSELCNAYDVRVDEHVELSEFGVAVWSRCGVQALLRKLFRPRVGPLRRTRPLTRAWRPMKRKPDEIIGEGRRYAYCDRPLRPNTEYVWVLGHLHEIPTAEQLKLMEQPTPPITHVADAVSYGYRKERVFRFRHSSTRDEQPYTEMGFWTGGYRGQGWIQGSIVAARVAA